MVIAGIDPGYGKLGYSIIEKHGPSFHVHTIGTIKTAGGLPHQKRLMRIHAELSEILRRWKPSIMSVERIFLTRNQKTALSVAEARGVVLLTAALAGLTVYEYTPPQVKLAITGSGIADKKAVAKMVTLMTRTSFEKEDDDAIDALALAITAAYDKNPSQKFL